MMIESIYHRLCAATSDINEHLPVLRDYASKCSHVTEFGVRGMISTWALLAAKPRRLVSYDKESPVGDLFSVKAMADLLKVDYEFVLGDTLEVEIESTDLLFIDTLHTMGQLAAELDRHSAKVRKFILLHDTETFGEKGEIEGTLGLRPALENFLARNDWWQVVERRTNNNGLTVLGRL